MAKGTKKFQDDYTDFAEHTVGEPLCMSCRHSNHDGTCKAFPIRIPLEILSGEANHMLPYKGDNGIQYELKEEDIG